MRSNAVSTTGYSTTRMTVDVGSTPADFRSRYEMAVPPLPVDEVKALVERQAPWQEMVDLISAAAPLGFLIYFKNDVDPVVRLAGDTASGVAHLMGNHITMERMYRYEPAVTMYAPLHTVIWGTQTARPTSPSASQAISSGASPTRGSQPSDWSSIASWPRCLTISRSPCPTR